MTYNYHTHTFMCSHATGTPEEYILRAIDCGITHMGFSDHAPFICSCGKEAGYRVPTARVGEYFSMLTGLREKYKDKIDIKIGFEMEYYPEKFNDMFNFVKKSGAEYLILGEHYMHEELPDGIHCNKRTEDEGVLEEYVNCIVSGIKSGVFTYIAHPDMVRFTGNEAVYNEKMRRICVNSREYNVPLELNFLGIRDGRNYPYGSFWEMAGQEKCPVVFGFDAHDVNAAFDGESLKKAYEMVEKYGLNYIGRPTVTDIQKKDV
ncbi:MAG: PHP domain-containing protein [Ruminococcaceae bacterium]|nr:PHP domain-containing protein [Oscillospiraceae bacterium]